MATGQDKKGTNWDAGNNGAGSMLALQVLNTSLNENQQKLL